MKYLILLLLSFNAYAQTFHDLPSTQRREMRKSVQGTSVLKDYSHFTREVSKALEVDERFIEHILNLQMFYYDAMDEVDDSRIKAGKILIKDFHQQLEDWDQNYQQTLAQNDECDCQNPGMKNVVTPDGGSSLGGSLLGLFSRNYFFGSYGPGQMQPPVFLKLVDFFESIEETLPCFSDSTKKVLDKFRALKHSSPEELLQGMIRPEMAILAVILEIKQNQDLYARAGVDLTRVNSKTMDALWFLHNAGYGEHRARYRECLGEKCGVSPSL